MVATIECIDRSRARDSCAMQGALADDGQVPSPASASRRSSSTPTTRATGAAQHPAPYDALGVGRRGLVEHRSGGGPPVDEQGVAVLVAQPDPTDVARRLGRVLQVETAEDQALVGRVERRDPPGRLEDHRVALDQPALVPEPRPAVTLTGQRLGGPGRHLELAVDPVDKPLLGRDLPRGEVSDRLFGHRGRTPRLNGPGPPSGPGPTDHSTEPGPLVVRVVRCPAASAARGTRVSVVA